MHASRPHAFNELAAKVPSELGGHSGAPAANFIACQALEFSHKWHVASLVLELLTPCTSCKLWLVAPVQVW